MRILRPTQHEAFGRPDGLVYRARCLTTGKEVSAAAPNVLFLNLHAVCVDGLHKFDELSQRRLFGRPPELEPEGFVHGS